MTLLIKANDYDSAFYEWKKQKYILPHEDIYNFTLQHLKTRDIKIITRPLYQIEANVSEHEVFLFLIKYGLQLN